MARLSRSLLPLTITALVLASTLSAVAGFVQSGEAARQPSGQVILDEGSPWRMFASWNTPVVRKDAELKEDSGVHHWFAAKTAPPPAEWMQPDFVDNSWSRWSGSTSEDDYGFVHGRAPGGPTLSLLCLRGRFAVEDPATVQKLSLSLAFRGGAVVYVNGQEVARAHLPKEGRIEPGTLAEEYPAECFEHPEVIRGTKSILATWRQPEKYKDQVDKRIRRLESLAIDAKLLRKGVNVLAVDIHRAPYFGNGLWGDHYNNPSVWSTCGLISLTLRVEGGGGVPTARPRGVQVWSSSDMRRPSPLDYGHPLEKGKPVSIVGCRNGAFDGRVMITSDRPIAGVKAKVSDLRHTEGNGVIPAAAVSLFYTVRDDKTTMRYRVPKDGFWDSLAEEPPAQVDVVPGAGAMQAIVLKVRVAAEAAPGDYAGNVTVSAEGLSATEVPVELKVIDWRLPDPRDFATHMGVIQSPDSVALQYKVPLWSEEHWKLMEESFRLLGELGNNYVVVPIISRTNFGNQESMIRWIRDGDGYKHDFAIFDRYLDLAQKYQKVDVVCLYAFEQYAGSVTTSHGDFEWTGGRKMGLKVTLWDPTIDKSEDLEGPIYENADEFRKFWGPVYQEISARLAKRGLSDAMMLGISGDYGGGGQPAKELSALYKELLPGAKWVANPHGDCRGGHIGGIPVGYNTSYYMNLCPPPETGKRYYGWQSKTDYHARSRGPTTPLPCWRAWIESVLVHNCSGRGRLGADFWPVLSGGRSKKSRSIAARYLESDWSQLNLDRGTEVILARGPRGAMPTENFEQMRQGIQECQARIFIEKALLDGKLDPALARKCQDLLDQRTWHIRGLGAVGGATSGESLIGRVMTAWYEGAGSAGMAEKLYAAAAEVAGKLGLAVKDLTYEVRRGLRLEDTRHAVVISKIESGSPAEVARLKPFELITAISGAPVASAEQFASRVKSALDAGEKSVRLTVEYLGKSRLAGLELTQADQQEAD